MLKLLSDIDISRSMVVASFLELEAAARSCMYSITTFFFEGPLLLKIRAILCLLDPLTYFLLEYTSY